MASYLKSIDGNHLLEAGLEGFYGQSKQEINPSFQVGTDFIANNRIPDIDFATVHSYPDQWCGLVFLLFIENLLHKCKSNTSYLDVLKIKFGTRNK